jgi:glycosyltransferase involved in cell wall biosynthesis
MHIFIHLLNDFSGSPRIINEKIGCYRQLGADCFVITNCDLGFIRVKRYPHRLVPYEKHPNMLIWALRLLVWHLRTFYLVLRLAGHGDIVHGSTQLTSPHMLAARLKGARTVSHIMETKVSPAIHMRLLLAFALRFSDRLVYLSAYVETALCKQFSGKPHRITYPCIDQTILDCAGRQPDAPSAPRPFTVGLICSLIWHKGYAEFVRLAAMCPEFRFVLVINGRPENFHAQFSAEQLPANLVLHFNLKDVSTALVGMDVLLSLTKREGWIETFGLTLIEAMAFGKPVIAPAIGAPAEFVDDGRNGYLVNEADLGHIAGLLRRMQGDPAAYRRMSEAARETSRCFTPTRFLESIRGEMQFVTG